MMQHSESEAAKQWSMHEQAASAHDLTAETHGFAPGRFVSGPQSAPPSKINIFKYNEIDDE